MAEKLQIAYYYITPEDLARIQSFLAVSGDSEKTLITQYVRGWIGRNREYYLKLARMDASARGLSLPDWGKTVLADGITALPDYQEELKDIPANPLENIAIPPSAERRGLNYILLGKQNIALLKVGIHYAGGNAINFISRIVKEHLARNWEKLYASQVEAENIENWK